VGTLKLLADSRTLLASVVAGVLTKDILSALLGGGIVFALNCSAYIAERRIKFKDVVRGHHSEVAAIYHIQTHLKTE
jgi:hypothetical protein